MADVQVRNRRTTTHQVVDKAVATSPRQSQVDELLHTGRRESHTRATYGVFARRAVVSPHRRHPYGGGDRFLSDIVRYPGFGDWVADRIIRGMQDKSDLLSIGFGTAHIERILIARGFNVTGVELVDEFISKAKERGLEAHQMSGEELMFPDQSFDGILYPESIGHMDHRKTLAEADRVLRPGGKIFILTHGYSIGSKKTRKAMGVHPKSEDSAPEKSVNLEREGLIYQGGGRHLKRLLRELGYEVKTRRVNPGAIEHAGAIGSVPPLSYLRNYKLIVATKPNE
ncbi:MAG: class I SAM-dependent methyltransferase [Candidatus Altiarchaeota archaeon]